MQKASNQELQDLDLSHLPTLDGRHAATAKQLAELSGRALSQVYATINIGATKKIGEGPLIDAESYFDYLLNRKIGRPSLKQQKGKETNP